MLSEHAVGNQDPGYDEGKARMHAGTHARKHEPKQTRSMTYTPPVQDRHLKTL